MLEICCGAGYSTLVLLLRDHHVLSVDNNLDAIRATKDLILENDYATEIATQSIDFGQKEAWLWQADAVGNRDQIITGVKQLPIDLVLICNPGGNLDSYIRKIEVDLLLQYVFTQTEINQRNRQGAFHLIHKFSMIDAAADIALNCGKPLMVVERGDKEQVSETLEQISLDTGMRRFQETYRRIRKPPEGGITLGEADGARSNEMYWGAGLFAE